ncbi:MAG: response regulator transcription factor [Myxococcales bacterium]|nr:response regulator transcription factor [Myxococcales bacterium]
MRILLVEDSERVSEAVGAALRRHGHRVIGAPDVRAASRALADGAPFDVAIVDVGLPDGSGLDWCRDARRAGSDLPILLLTARNGVSDRVAGLDAGADDYLGKPFAIDELLARVRALTRRGPRWTESVRRFEDVELDRDRRVLTVAGERLALTAREFDIVALLAWREGRVVPRDEILEAVWGDTSDSAAASFEVLLVRIRRKLALRGVRDALRTIRQVGYAWSLPRSKPA